MNDLLTKREVKGLVDFGRKVERRISEDPTITMAEISQQTARPNQKAISIGTISDICRVGRQDRKPFRLSPDKAIRIAEAIGWDKNEAVQCLLGFQDKAILDINEQTRDLVRLYTNLLSLGFPEHILSAIRVIAERTDSMLPQSQTTPPSAPNTGQSEEDEQPLAVKRVIKQRQPIKKGAAGKS